MNDYFNWLLDYVNPNHSHSKLIDEMHRFTFTYKPEFPLDSNVALAGKDIILDYIEENNIKNPVPLLRGKGCSFLEALIGLAKIYQRMNDSSENADKNFFWEMLDNSSLIEYDDDNFDLKKVMKIISKIIDRQYRADGVNTLFPRKKGMSVQNRDLPLIHQMNAYIREKRRA